jgi:pimeloyl-ACP methyl ester carboxylesterase
MEFVRAGTRLMVHDFGGNGPAMLLVHGLAGYAGEWRRSAELLGADHHVFALDQRGHGDSEPDPADVSRAAFAADCAAAIRRISTGQVMVVGQSMGAITAMLTAAKHPELVNSLIMIEGAPTGPEVFDPDPEAAHAIRESLASWPVPFADERAAGEFFASKGLDPDAWTAGLHRRKDGLWPRWKLDPLVASMADLAARNYWTDWESLQCPVLIVMGQNGIFPHSVGDEMVARLPSASLVRITGAGHDVHLDAPAQWVASAARWSNR